MAHRLKNKVAIVTGAADGIGRATVERFRAEGAKILATDIADTRLSATHAEGDDLRTFACDVANPAAADALVGAALAAFGGLDILVNNAGICDYARVEATDDATWERALSINLTAVFRLCRRAIPELKRSKAGRIVNTASIMAHRSYLELAAYSSSKHAVAGLTKTLAIELGGDGITANYILPGATVTGITRALLNNDPGLRSVYDDMGVLGRMAEPSEVANAVLFLASEEASFVTGHGLAVDGGALARL